MLTAEAKSIPLIHERARQSGAEKYFVARKGLKVYGSSYVLGTCAKDTSTWVTADHEKYFYDKGALVRHLFPRCPYLMAPYFAIRFKRETSLGVWQRLKLVFRGVRGGKKLLPYEKTL